MNAPPFVHYTQFGFKNSRIPYERDRSRIFKVVALDDGGERGPMVPSEGGKVARDLENLWSTGTLTGASDAQLLQRFTHDRGATAELAFRELLEWHAPMVMGVCRHIVRRSQDVDDAFQATFLVLVRKARSIQVRESSVRGSTKSRTGRPSGPRGFRLPGTRPPAWKTLKLRGRRMMRGARLKRRPFSTTRSADCRRNTGRRSCFATLKARRTRRLPAR